MKLSDLKGYKVVKSGTGVIPAETQTPSFTERASGVIQRRGQQLQESISGTGADAGKSPIRRGFEAVAETASAVPELALEATPEVIREPIKKVGEGIGTAFKSLTDFIGGNPELQKFVVENPKLAKAIEETAGTLSAGGEIAGNILGAKATAGAVSKTGDLVKKGVTRGTTGILTRSKELITPSPTPTEAVGEILQGKTTDIAPAIKALGAVDTQGVKTNVQLKGKLDDAISTLSKQVDDELAKDTSVTLLDDLITTSKTKGGAEVQRNFVSDSLNHLDELYTKTADDVSLAEIRDLVQKARTTGLTKQEVNDISRIYGQEFGNKAFSKTGDPLTSVNAQMYENIRTGLKDVARSGIGGEAAKKADSIISSLYSTRKLVEKNVEAVQKLQQRIADRGLLEQLGHAVSKYADVLTGGTIRGLIGGLLPRGAGYKVLNALDLEKRLGKNLKIIKDATDAKTPKQVEQLLKQLEIEQPLSKTEPVSSPKTNKKLQDFKAGKSNSEGGFIANPVASAELRSFVSEQTKRLERLRGQGMSVKSAVYKRIEESISEASKLVGK